jgi:hypothetical protein
MRPAGRSSRSARNGAVDIGWVTHGLVVVGIVLSLGLIIVSVILNFRVGYRAADTELDGWIYGCGAGMADGLKALAPFAIHAGWKNRDWLAVVTASCLFVAISAYTFSAELGFATQHRLFREGEQSSATEKHGDLRRQLERAELRLTALGTQRSAAEVEKAVASVMARVLPRRNRTVEQVSSRCTLNREESREACAEVAVLGEELARAREHETLKGETREVRTKLDALRGGTVKGSGDPQMDAMKLLAGLTGRDLEREGIQAVLSVLVALFIELGSGVGLYVATTPWRGRTVEHTLVGQGARRLYHKRVAGWLGSGRKDRRETETSAMRLGPVDVYAMERLEPRLDGEVGEEALFADYVVWCRWRGETPYEQRLFLRQMMEIGEEVGIPRRELGGNRVYCDVGLLGR